MANRQTLPMRGLSTRLAVLLAAAAGVLSACSPAKPDDTAQIRQAVTSKVLPLAIPIEAVMAGPLNRASNSVFRLSVRDRQLTEDEWTQIAVAAVDLVGLASLITLPTTSPNDLAWTSDARWLGMSTDMQQASLAVGRAATHADKAALSESVSRLAQSCQSCHLVFSSKLIPAPPI